MLVIGPRSQQMLMSAPGLVSRVTPVQTALRNCTGDEGRPFGSRAPQIGGPVSDTVALVLISNRWRVLFGMPSAALCAGLSLVRSTPHTGTAVTLVDLHTFLQREPNDGLTC